MERRKKGDKDRNGQQKQTHTKSKEKGWKERMKEG